jgi:hypothetical protein
MSGNVDNVKAFKDKFAAGAYQNIGSVNRALGKFQGLSDGDKASLKTWAEKKFASGDIPAPAPKAAPAKRGRKPNAEKVAAAAAPATVEQDKPKAKRGRKPNAAKAAATAPTGHEDPMQDLSVTTSALERCKDMKQIDPELDVSELLSEAKAAVHRVLVRLNKAREASQPQGLTNPAGRAAFGLAPINGVTPFASNL